jgi:hypothetical protein
VGTGGSPPPRPPYQEVTEVVLEALRTAGDRWHTLSKDMVPIRNDVADLGLDVSAFYIGDLSAGPHHNAYEEFRTFMVDVLSGAISQFGLIGDALVEAARRYEQTDNDAAVRASEIFGQ